MAFIYLLVAVILCGGTLWLWRVRKAQIVTLPVKTPLLASHHYDIPEEQATPMDINILLVTPYSLGIAMQGGRFYKLIEIGSLFPVSVTRRVWLNNVSDSDTEMVVEIYQGEEELVSGNTKIGEVPIKTELVTPGWRELEVQFLVAIDGTLTVRIIDLQTRTQYERYFTALLEHQPASPPQTIECIGKAVLPKRVYMGDAQNISLMLHRNVKIPGLLPESLQVQEITESDRRVLGQEGNKQVEVQIQQKDSHEQYLEVELIAAGFTTAGDLKQRQSLASERLAYRWNCYFLNSGNQAMTLVLRVGHPSEGRELGTIQHNVKVTKFANLTARQIGMVTWISAAATFISTVLGIAGVFHHLP